MYSALASHWCYRVCKICYDFFIFHSLVVIRTIILLESVGSLIANLAA